MKKIAIIGCAGSGKSTLALKLHSVVGVPVYHLDQYYWKPQWIQPEFSQFTNSHNEICDTSEWIIDGMYFRTLYYRLQSADTIIFLDVPRIVCVWRVLKRLILYYGKITPSSAPGCPERFDWTFLRWVWNFNKRTRKSLIFLLDELTFEKKVIILRSTKEIHRFLESLEHSSA